MDIFAEIHADVQEILKDIISEIEGKEIPLDRFVVEASREVQHGEIALNAALIYFKEFQSAYKTPRALAERIVAQLQKQEKIQKIEIAGPGFINLWLTPQVWFQVLHCILKEKEDYGRPSKADPSRNKGRINIEYVSGNPTGPLHIGHCRGAVFGDSLANLLVFCGHEVVREYYINDSGQQVDILARSVYLRYQEALGQEIKTSDLTGLYPGEYLKTIGEKLAIAYGKTLLTLPEEKWLPTVRDQAIHAMMDTIREDLEALKIHHDVFFSEKSLLEVKEEAQIASHPFASPSPSEYPPHAVGRALHLLKQKNLLYHGRLPPPKGYIDEDWEDLSQTLFRSTAFGDESDRVVVKADGTYTYFATDIAYHRSKFERGFNHMIAILGSDHGGYTSRLQAAVASMSEGQALLEVKICQLVHLMREGVPVKMSKRAGEFVTLRSVIEEVGYSAVRFMMLFRKNDAPLEFDLAKTIEQSKENPVFYVQYAHARACSVLRQAYKAFPGMSLSEPSLSDAPLSLLKNPSELGVIKFLAQYPRLIQAAATHSEPHRIAFYVHELASFFHAHWNHGKEREELRFVQEESPDLTYARVALVSACRNVLASGLSILGVDAPEEMR